MPVKKVVATNVKKLPAPTVAGAPIEYLDQGGGGFYLRVTASGHRSYGLLYRTAKGKLVRYTIGPLDRWSLADARVEARKKRSEANLGADPQADKVEARKAPDFETVAGGGPAAVGPGRRLEAEGGRLWDTDF